jgi:CheY-like chemotaxis protein
VSPSFRPLSSKTECDRNDGNAEAILLVDADDTYVSTQTRCLQRLGYPYVFRAHSVVEARDMLKHLCPTIVLTDGVNEGAAAWMELLKCLAELGVSTAVVTSEPWHGRAVADLRVVTKAQLTGGTLERLIHDLVAENRARRRDSVWRLRSVAEDAAPICRTYHLKSA